MAPPRRVVQAKLRTQLELKLQEKMLKSLSKQGWFATKTADRFQAGRPDIRLGHDDFGQMDVELKYSLEPWNGDLEQDTGLKKLQMIKIREMNEHGMPATGLVYSEPLDLFFVTTLLRDTLPPASRCIKKLPGSEVIHGPELFVKAMEHLNDLGYHGTSRDWRQTWPRSGA